MADAYAFLFLPLSPPLAGPPARTRTAPFPSRSRSLSCSRSFGFLSTTSFPIIPRRNISDISIIRLLHWSVSSAPRPDGGLVMGSGRLNSGSFLMMGRISDGGLPNRGRSLTRRYSSGHRSDTRWFSESRRLSLCVSSLLGLFSPASELALSLSSGRFSRPAAPRVDSSLTYFCIRERRSERLTGGFLAINATNDTSVHTLVRMLTAVLKSRSTTFITSIWKRFA
ncbi:hypothetical protein Taro_015195 [Colocasia esculenta]|uniref:Uncharacterized protein n=1 Tax=Colocasia esculenta TaxID=4460 RepID=A0A843UK71_COLES|nr:hypothetical protein [Colocasia esculenta]